MSDLPDETIRYNRCPVHENGSHRLTDASESNHVKGFSKECVDCGERFYLFTETQIDRLLEHLPIRLSIAPTQKPKGLQHEEYKAYYDKYYEEITGHRPESD